MRACGENPHVLTVDGPPLRKVATLQKIGERAQVARVVSRRVRRKAAFAAQMPEIGVDATAIDAHTLGACQRVGDELAHALQELGAHAGMEAVPFGAAKRQQPDRAGIAQRH